MLNDFIRQTLEFLKYSDIHIESPSIESIEFRSDGTHGFTMSCYGFTGAAEIRNNVVLNVTIFFSLLDVLVDKKFPDLEGRSLRRRYLGLPAVNDYQILFKETYRIMKLFRNSVVHSKSSVVKNDDGFSIDYNYKDTRYRLSIGRPALRLLFSMIVHFARLQDSPYVTGILRSYYDKISDGITILSDDIGSRFGGISGGLRLKGRRYRTKDRAYRFDEGSDVLWISRFELAGPEQSWAGLDYYVTVNGQLYLIPDEALHHSGTITKDNMEDWIYDKDRFFC